MPEATPVDAFDVALREAIAVRGISLDQLRKSLSRKGVTISAATLSYWQSGRSRPERTSSLAAIGPLEECLELPRGFLASRLPSARRTQAAEQPYTQGVLPTTGRHHLHYIDEAVEQLGMSYADTEWVSAHDCIRFDSRRHEAGHDVRLLLRAVRDGLARFPVWLEAPGPASIPVVSAHVGCVVGRVREFAHHAAVAVEMLLPRPLRRGETSLVELRLEFLGPQTPQDRVWRRVTSPSREVVIEVRFDEAVIPAEACAVSVSDGRRRETSLVPGPIVQGHFVDSRPGVFSVEWTW